MSKKKKTKPVYQSENSPSIFILPTVILLTSILTLFFTNNQSIFIILLIFSMICFVPCYLTFKFRKYIITNNKIYVYDNEKKILGWSFSDDFDCVDYKQSKTGVIFGFGNLYISNKNKKFYIYKYIKNPEEAYIKTILQYEKIAVMLDPNYIPRYNSNEDVDIVNNNNNKITVDRVSKV